MQHHITHDGSHARSWLQLFNAQINTPNQNLNQRSGTMSNRKRNTQLILRVTPEEKDFIYKKMGEFGTANFNAYARKMLIDGYIIKLDLAQFQMLAGEVNKIGTNINQIAKVANTTGAVFGDDVEKLKEAVNEIWQLLKSSLSALLSKSR